MAGQRLSELVKSVTSRISGSRFARARRFIESGTGRGRCTISINTGEVVLAVVRRGNPAHVVERLEILPREDDRPLSSLLAAAVRHFDLAGMSCALILHPEDYQLFLMDALPVSPGEFQTAIRWKVAPLLSYPVEDALIDSFEVPEQKTHTPQPMIIVAVARTSQLMPVIKNIRESGLSPDYIGIEELAWCRIASLYQPDEKVVAILYFGSTSCQVIIVSQGLLYLQRPLGMAPGIVPAGTEAVALEIQRSFDFCQTQWRVAPPCRLLLTSTLPGLPLADIAGSLSKQLAVPISILDSRDPAFTGHIASTVRHENCLLNFPVLGYAIQGGRKFASEH